MTKRVAAAAEVEVKRAVVGGVKVTAEVRWRYGGRGQWEIARVSISVHWTVQVLVDR